MASKTLYSTVLAANDSAAQEEIGLVRKEYSSTDSCFKVYKYVQCSGTIVNGTALTFHDTKGTIATDDISTTGINQVAGVGIGTITDRYYGWIQIGGYHSVIKTDAGDDIADGDSLIIHASTDGVVDRTASGTAAVSKVVGIAVAADIDADDTVAGLLCCGYSDIV